MAAEGNGDQEDAPESAEARPLAEHLRKTIQDEAEDARRRILGTRTRTRAAAPPPGDEVAIPEGFDEEIADVFRRLVEGIEDETHRLEEQAAQLRTEVDKATATLRREIERAAELLVVRDAEDAQQEEVHVQAVDRLADAIGRAADTGVERIEAALTVLDADVTRIAGAVAQLRVPEGAADEPGARVANFGGDLLKALELVAEQLSGFSQRVEQLPDRIADRLGPAAGERDEATTEVLARLADEVARLRRRLPVRRTLAESTKKSAEDEGESPS